jgi:glyoxalase family protein
VVNPFLIGIHHVTAVTAHARNNLHFYTQILGMRLVKKTVNQDDVTAYHLFYADAVGSPGSDLTFFDWAQTPPQEHGNHSISLTGLRLPSAEALGWWKERFAAHHLAHAEIGERFGRSVLDFTDPEGLPLSLVADPLLSDYKPWDRSPVPADKQILALGPVAITIPELAPTEKVLCNVLGLTRLGTYSEPGIPEVVVYGFHGKGAGAELHVRVQPDLPFYSPGAGGVHHVAFRVTDDQYDAWADRLNRHRVPNSGKVNRFYFRSLYFREPNHILFELATDGPGFATDEDSEHLGERLALPPFLERRRTEIEAGLKPL